MIRTLVTNFGSSSYDVSLAVNTLQKTIGGKAAGYLMAKLTSNASDAAVLMMSDSTGNEEFESHYLLTQWYATQFPAYTVHYYLWDEDSGDYAAHEVIQTGTGANTLSVYNAAFPGSRPSYFMAARYAKAIRDIPTVDLFIMNHGHNIGDLSLFNGVEAQDDRAMLFVGAIMPIVERHACGVLMSSQNPNRDDDDKRPYRDMLAKAAELLNADITDSFERFETAGKNPIYYNDNVHPSELGHTALILPSLIAQHASLIGRRAVCSLSEPGANLLENGSFASFDGAVPDEWVNAGCTASKDTGNYESENGYSLRLDWDGSSGTAFISQNVSTARLARIRGKRITLAARRWIAEGEPAVGGRVRLKLSSSSDYLQTRTYFDGMDGRGGWEWAILSGVVPQDSTLVQVVLMANGGIAGGANFDRVMLCVGDLPKDCAIA